MAAITPPPMIVRVHRAPSRMGSGDEMDFTLWAGPVPLHWVARTENVSPDGFTDRQVRGPFGQWVHRHSFVQVDERTTDVLDEVTVELRAHPLWGPVGLGMWLTLPLLFAFRAWKTKRILERSGLAR